MQNPVVLIPGIKGTELANTYPIKHEITWSVPNMFFTDVYPLALDPGGEVDRSLEVMHRSWQVFSIVYKPLYDYLRGRLNVPVYIFGYDWRLSNRTNAERLREFIARLKKKPDLENVEKFDVVCHSMGGLLLRAALEQWKAANEAWPVERVAFIATPHHGSLDAVDAMIRGESVLLQSKSDMRKIARTMPASYELLPTFDGAISGNATDIFDVASWQENVVNADPPYALSRSHLARAKKFHDEALCDPAELGASNVLQLYGDAPKSTMVEVPVVEKRSEGLKRWYDFDDAVKDRGDGVVPVHSAVLPGLPAVRILKSDLRWYEFRDQALVRALSFHGFMPVMNEVCVIVARFFAGERGDGRLPRGMPASRFVANYQPD